MAKTISSAQQQQLVLILGVLSDLGLSETRPTQKAGAELLRGEPVGNRRPTSRAGHSDRRSRTAASNGDGDQRGSAQAEAHTRAAIGGSG